MLSVCSRYVGAPVSKVAELKKLRTGRQDKPVLGAEISSLGVSFDLTTSAFRLVHRLIFVCLV
jgi:hypothetical protein